jgi:hypothetical protein
MRASISFVALCRPAAVLMLLLFVATVTFAQITPSDDAYVNSAAPTANYGTAGTLDVSSAADTVFIRFDLTAVPASYTGAFIAKATLKLYVNTVTTAGSFNVDLVNGTWTEKTIDYSKEPALGTTIAASVPLTTASKGTYVEIDITPAMVEWLNGTQPNDGIALVANSPLVATFDSKENTAASHSAEIDIVYASGGTLTGVTTASGSGLIGGGTSGTLNLSLTNACAANQVLQWNGTAWVCATVGTGTITGVAAGTDLTGGGSSGNVTLNLDITQVPQLNYANFFTGNQTVNGNLSASGLVTGAAFNIGSNLFAFGTYANQNAFLGFAGNSAMTGTGNTASGVAALQSNTTGAGNTAVGNNTLQSNTTGGYNTAVGSIALVTNTTGSYNNAIGFIALLNNTTGRNNNAVGQLALLGNTTGSNNTAVGDVALQTNTTGSYITCVGANCNTGADGLTNATAIGANAEVTQNNSLVLGSVNGVNSATASTNVGIGTTAPQYALDVHGTGNFTGLVSFAPGQQFPGSGTITGVTAGTDLTGGGTSGNVTLNVDTTKVVTGVTAGTDLTGGGAGGVQILNLDTTKVPQLASANTFTGAQTFNNSVMITSAAADALTVTGASSDGVYSSGAYAGLFGQGTGSTGTGVIGQGYSGGHFVGSAGDGVSGGSSQGNGVYGGGVTGVYGSGTSIGVNGIGPSYGVLAQGNLGATGTKSAVVALADDRVVSLYAMESPENWFEDFGSGELKDGVGTIKLDATFAETISPEMGYHVFVTPNGDCEGLYVAQKTATGFEVRELHAGKSSVAFDYRIVAKRKGLESVRMEEVSNDHETAASIRQFMATRSSNTPRLKLPKPPRQAKVHEPSK